MYFTYYILIIIIYYVCESISLRAETYPCMLVYLTDNEARLKNKINALEKFNGTFSPDGFEKLMKLALKMSTMSFIFVAPGRNKLEDAYQYFDYTDWHGRPAFGIVGFYKKQSKTMIFELDFEPLNERVVNILRENTNSYKLFIFDDPYAEGSKFQTLSRHDEIMQAQTRFTKEVPEYSKAIYTLIYILSNQPNNAKSYATNATSMKETYSMLRSAASRKSITKFSDVAKKGVVRLGACWWEPDWRYAWREQGRLDRQYTNKYIPDQYQFYHYQLKVFFGAYVEASNGTTWNLTMPNDAYRYYEGSPCAGDDHLRIKIWPTLEYEVCGNCELWFTFYIRGTWKLFETRISYCTKGCSSMVAYTSIYVSNSSPKCNREIVLSHGWNPLKVVITDCYIVTGYFRYDLNRPEPRFLESAARFLESLAPPTTIN